MWPMLEFGGGDGRCHAIEGSYVGVDSDEAPLSSDGTPSSSSSIFPHHPCWAAVMYLIASWVGM